MTLAIIYTRATCGISAPLVTVEVHTARGLPKVNIVGLPAAVVKESKDRVRSAILNTQFEFPRGRLTINLAPADLPKEGGYFDLPIALGILAATKQIPAHHIAEYEFVGELALSGELRSIRAVLAVVLGAKTTKRTLIVPKANKLEAGLIDSQKVFAANHLLEVCAFLKGQQTLELCFDHNKPPNLSPFSLDLNEVKGQFQAKRALEIAAAGKHSMLFIGPPGTGKTMLASRLTGILPDLNDEQAIETAAITSISNKGFDAMQWRNIPFRSPHHSASPIALVGGGRPPRPGEISLSHHGVLFLDELPEFNRHALECLREPLESGCITISRATYQVTFPALFQLIAAMNPCPCGFAGSHQIACICTQEQVQRYWSKLSGPLLDRIDMQIEMPSLNPQILSKIVDNPEPSQIVKKRVIKTRQFQLQRQQKCNQDLSTIELQKMAELSQDANELLHQSMEKFNFSARTYHRIIKVARTIADLVESHPIEVNHVQEALMYRKLDRSIFVQKKSR